MKGQACVIGLTGGIGSGKSTVLDMFKRKGGAVFVADKEAKDLMHTDRELIADIKNLLGSDVYVDTKLQTQKVADVVFKDPVKLNALNKLVHPKVKQRFQEALKECKADLLFYESALLFESNTAEFCDYVIVVFAPLKTRVDRIMKRDKVSRAEIQLRMNNQTDDFQKLLKSDFVIENHMLHTTEQQVNTIFDLLLKLRE